MNKQLSFFLPLSALVALGMLAGCNGKLASQVTGNEVRNVSGANQDPETNPRTVRIGSINWYVNYEDALAVAKQTNKPIWLHFGENPG